ncbi:MAG: Gfo/Idh/MocA family oxidoreductase [Chloroflexota bacterium]
MRIAFIGSGGIARQHAKGLMGRADVQCVGAYDVMAERAQAFAADHGGAAYTALGDLLDTARPDAAWVCLPPFAHGEAELALLARRIPFLVEKPISNSLDVARRILDEVQRTGTLVAAGYMNRYRRGVQRLRELLASDPPVLLHAAWAGGTPGVSWWRVKAQSGGQIVEQTTHLFDVARYLAGEPERVCAVGARGFVGDMPGYDVDDASAVAVQFASGAVGSLMSCCANRAGVGGVYLSVMATHLAAQMTGWELNTTIDKSRFEHEQITGEPDIFAIEDAAFLRAVQSGDPQWVRSPYADAIKTLAFCLAADQAVATGLPVTVASL